MQRAVQLGSSEQLQEGNQSPLASKMHSQKQVRETFQGKGFRENKSSHTQGVALDLSPAISPRMCVSGGGCPHRHSAPDFPVP